MHYVENVWTSKLKKCTNTLLTTTSLTTSLTLWDFTGRYMKQVFNRRPLVDPLFQCIPSFFCTVNLFVGFFVSMLCAIFSHQISDKCNWQIYRIYLMCLSMKNVTANSVKLKNKVNSEIWKWCRRSAALLVGFWIKSKFCLVILPTSKPF